MRTTFKILFSLLILFQSCKEKEPEKKVIKEIEYNNTKENNKTVRSNSEKGSDSKLKTEFSFLDNIKTVQLPYRDSTNFDNHKIGKLLTKEQIEKLSLDKVFEINPNAYDAFKIGINYRVDLSNSFKTFVFYNYFLEFEMSSVIVNYDSEFNVIDHKMIAMDEIAESVLRTESTIEKNKIIITNFQFWNETIEETKNIEVESDGKLKTSG